MIIDISSSRALHSKRRRQSAGISHYVCQKGVFKRVSTFNSFSSVNLGCQVPRPLCVLVIGSKCVTVLRKQAAHVFADHRYHHGSRRAGGLANRVVHAQ